MAKLLKRLWEYMDLTVLPVFGTRSAHIFGGWQRVCWCTNEAFNQASPTKEFWENCPQKKGGHIYDKNEGGGIITIITVLCSEVWYQSQTLIFGHLSSRQLSKGLWRNAKCETKLWNFVIWSNLSVVSLLAPLLHHLLLLLPHFSNQLTTNHMMMIGDCWWWRWQR